jgi:hypothetical protein
MVPSSVITVAADGERLTCGGFFLSETIRLVSFEFITDYFDSLSRSLRRGDSGATFMGSTHSGTPSLRWTMVEDSTEEFLTVSSGEGAFGFSLHRRRGTGALPVPIGTIPWMENAPATQAMMTVPSQTTVPLSDTGLPFK